MYMEQSSLVDQLNQLLQGPELKSVYSFGHSSSSSFEYGKETAQFSPIDSQESALFNLSSHIQSLDIVSIRTQKKHNIENLESCTFCYSNQQKLKQMSQKVKQSQSKLIMIVKELQKLKDFSSQFIQSFDLSSIVEEVSKQIKQKIEEKVQRVSKIGSPKSENQESKLMKCYQSTQNWFSSYLSSNQQNVAKQFQMQVQKCKQLLRLQDEGFLKQIVILQKENINKSEQIRFLKSQITALEKLNQNKEGYFNQKLKLKQFQLQQKLDLSNNNPNLQKRRRNSEQSGLQIIHKISPKNNLSSFPIRHRNSIQNSLTFDEKRPSMQGMVSDSKIQIMNRVELQIWDKLKTGQHSRKNSTECSFERVSQKLKKIKTSMKEEIVKLSH